MYLTSSGTDGLFVWLGTNEAVGECLGAREHKTMHFNTIMDHTWCGKTLQEWRAYGREAV